MSRNRKVPEKKEEDFRITIKKLRSEIKELEAEIIQLNQLLINNKVRKEEKKVNTVRNLKNLTPIERANLEKEETRKKWAEWRLSLNKKEEEKNES